MFHKIRLWQRFDRFRKMAKRGTHSLWKNIRAAGIGAAAPHR
ncbi:hypothetical protein [Alkalilacustris brevis]|nr:hypothetical protein [Alkalilacustris brevis]